ncbi:MAG: D-alanyl-D-alanine endopeptidase [Gammaproteobacteria bacterium]
MSPGILAPVALLAALLLSSAGQAETPPLTLAAIGPGGQFDNASPVEGLVRRPAVDIKSRAALVVRADNGEVLYRKNSDRNIPIASITKLMTAMVVLDAGQSLDERLKISAEDVDRLRNTHSRLAVGTVLTRRDLMILALMSSENRAASALLRNYPGGKKAGVAAMNRKAREIGMATAKFVEGTGLSGDNRSSPVDLVRLVKAADAYPEIREYSTMTELDVKVGRHVQSFRNTNPLVKSEEWSIGLTKTGFLNEAGRCLVMQAQVAGMPVIFVLMDSVGKLTRVGDANRVRRWLEEMSPVSQMARSDI